MSQEKSEKKGLTRSPTMANLSDYLPTEQEEFRRNVTVRKPRKKVYSFLNQNIDAINDFNNKYKEIKASLNPSDDLIKVYSAIINLHYLIAEMEEADKIGKHQSPLLNLLLAKSCYLFAACTFYYELSAPISDIKVHVENRKTAYETLLKAIARGLTDDIHNEAYNQMVSFHDESKKYSTYRLNAQKKVNQCIWKEDLRRAVVHNINCANIISKINEIPELYLENAKVILEHALDKDIYASTADYNGSTKGL